jgi:DNA uptake protein ComE-like DNA-binding protein
LSLDVLETLNTGTKSALLALQGIGDKRAQMIQSFQASGRTFGSMTDLVHVGMSEKQIGRFYVDNITCRIV